MKFSEIIGQNDIKKRLVKAVNDGRISHAIMFLGPEGCGKLPLAIAYAQYISCLDRKDDDSCGVCSSCVKYNKLVHPDLHFVFPVVKTDSGKDVVSDNFLTEWRETVLENPYFTLNMWSETLGADNKQASIMTNESNEIIKKLSFKTYESEYKIMIVWLPEKMNASTSNKLLKILEEPYDKTVFVLVSEDSGQIIQTILSRTQLLKIPKVDDKSLKNYLMQKFDLNDTTALNITKLSNGNIILASSIAKENETVEYNLSQFISLMRLAYTNDVAKLIEWSNEMALSSREKIKNFLSYALRMIRENFTITNNRPELALLTSTENDFSAKFHPFINNQNVGFLSEEFNKAYYHVERNGNAKIIMLDLALKVMGLLKRQ